jgi:hypothetical protein
MWPFNRPPRDTTHRQAATAEPARPRPRWRLFVLVSLALLVVALLGMFWADMAFWAGDGRLTGTVWKHEQDDATIVVEFGRRGYIVGSPVMRYMTSRGSATGCGSVTYTVQYDNTLTLASGDKLTIDSISSERLVLSGGPWKLDKTEFRKLQ